MKENNIKVRCTTSKTWDFTIDKIYTLTPLGLIDNGGYIYTLFLISEGKTLFEKWRNWTRRRSWSADFELIDDECVHTDVKDNCIKLGRVTEVLVKVGKSDRICQELLDDIFKMSYNEVEELIKFYRKGN